MANELNSNQIAQILPHRFPFALVDRITDYEPGQWAKGRKCVSVNEQFFCQIDFVYFAEKLIGDI